MPILLCDDRPPVLTYTMPLSAWWRGPHKAAKLGIVLSERKLADGSTPQQQLISATASALILGLGSTRPSARSAYFALRALARNPREVDEAIRFLRLLPARDRAAAQALAPAYSAAELTPGA